MKYDVLLPSRRQIRLLTLQASRRFKDPIQCSLHTISLDNEPEFWALSYVWGNPSVTVDITVDGSPVEATTNLASALRHIRRAFGQVVIWVDAVCINQKDDEERGKQVQMMGTIYTKAAKVIGWLGPEADNSRLALATLRGIARAKMDYILSMCAAGRWDDVAQATSADAERNHLGWLREAPQLGPKFWWGGNLRSVGLLIKRGDWKHLAWTLYPKFAVLSPAWKAIRHFFQRDYWIRVWILQEFALATNLVLMCGHDILEPEAIESLSQMLNTLHLCELGQHPKWMDSGAFSAFSNDTTWKPAYMTVMLRSQPDTDRQLRHLVADFQVLEATNPRDRIYALLGLAVDAIEPKYGRSVVEVYSEFAAKWIMEDRDTSILAHAELSGYRERKLSKQRSDLPSWVPDWESAAGEMGKLFRFGSRLQHGKGSMDELERYRASLDRPCTWRVSDDGKVLFAPGLHLDVISSLGPDLSLGGRDRFREYFLQYSQFGDRNYPTGISKAEALFRLYLLDVDLFTHERLDCRSRTYAQLAYGFVYGIIAQSDAEPTLSQVEAAVALATELSALYLEDALEGAAVYTTMFATLLGTTDRLDAAHDAARETLQLDLVNSAKDADSLLKMQHGMIGWINRRSVFQTEKGYLGIGPQEMQSGDIVTVLEGCNMPAVLRRVDSDYVFLGLCFVLGLMDGEGFSMLEEGGAVAEEFAIR